MNLIRPFVISSILMLVGASPASAVKVSNQNLAAPATSSANRIVERGGTVDAVNLTKKTIVVDKIKYALPVVPVKVHAPSGTSELKTTTLKAGTQIRFNTSKENFAGQEQVSEIWVTNQITKVTRKKKTAGV